MSTDRKLDELTTGSAVANADLFYSEQGGVSKKQPASAVRTYVFSGSQGDTTLSGGFAYLGGFNSTSFPATGIGAAFGWNFTGGNGEVDVWNVFPQASPTNDGAAFVFKQMTGTGTARTVAAMYQHGRFDCELITIGGFTGQANQLELVETGLASSSAPAQARFSRTEANTATDEAQIIITHHKTGGSGNVVAADVVLDTTVGSANFFSGFTVLSHAIKDGAAYHGDIFGGIFTAQVDAALPLCTATGLELDVDARGDVATKIGLAVVDESTSVGQGTGTDTGIQIGRQAGGRGFNYAIQFGFNPANAAAEINNAFFYCPSGTIPYALDFSGATFSTAAWKGNFSATGTVKGLVTTVGSLPSAATAGVGARAFVTDANATTFASTVAGSGSNKVPVYSDGTNWKIG